MLALFWRYITGQWLHFDQVTKRWLELEHFRFCPPSQLAPRVQTLSLRNGTLIDPGPTTITLTFTHWVEPGDASSGGAILIHDADGALYKSVSTLDVDHVHFVEDTMTVTVPLPADGSWTVTLSENAVHSVPRARDNGNQRERVLSLQLCTLFVSPPKVS